MNTKGMLAICAGISAVALTGTADAALVVQFNENGSGVTATTSGSIDLSGLTNLGFMFPSYGVQGSRGLFGTGTPLPYASFQYSGFSGASSFGTGSLVKATTSVGTSFFLRSDFSRIALANDYVSGSSINATSFFSGATLASLGLTAGQYVYRSAADTITVQIGAVPEPATWAMMLLGFGVVGGVMRSARRKQKVSVSYA